MYLSDMLKQKRYSYRWIKSCAPKPRFFRLKHILTGNIIEGVNISKWCREQGFKSKSHQDFQFLFNGTRKQVHGYCLPKTNIKPLEIKNLITGKIFKDVTARGLAKQIGINFSVVEDIVFKRRERKNEWARPDFNMNKIKNLPLLKNSKTGEEYRLYTSWGNFCNKKLITSDSAQTIFKNKGWYKDWVWINWTK